MNSEDFEGSLVLEKVAEIGCLDKFYEAVDNDDLVTAKAIMKRAKLDSETIEEVLRQMIE